MKKNIKKSLAINSSKENIWKILTDPSWSNQWLSTFCDGSYSNSNWEEGAEVLFLDNSGNGLLSKVVVYRPFEEITLQHLANWGDNKEDRDSDEAKKWIGLKESYLLEENSTGITTLTIDQEIDDTYYEMFNNIWNTTLEKIKLLAEKTSLLMH